MYPSWEQRLEFNLSDIQQALVDADKLKELKATPLGSLFPAGHALRACLLILPWVLLFRFCCLEHELRNQENPPPICSFLSGDCLVWIPKLHIIAPDLTLQLSSHDGIIILCINFKEHHGRGYRKTGRTKKSEEGPWKAILWVWYSQHNQGTTAATALCNGCE